MKTFIALFFAVLAVSAHKGLDLSIYSGVTTVSQFQCLQKAGYDFMILEEWVENHAASNFEATYKNAISAGFQEVDAYAFICNTCKGTHTAQQVITGITGNLGSSFSGMIWLDIEPCSGCWSSNGETNYEFAKTIATTLQAAGHKIGIYSSGWAWTSVMPGVKSTWFSQFPLWYAHYDNVESFNDPKSFTFAGWNAPAMKQYLGDKQGQCNVPDYDIDWAPNFVNTNGPSNATPNKNANPTPAPQQNSQAQPSKASDSQGSQQQPSQQTQQTQQQTPSSQESTKTAAQASNPNANTPSSQESKSSQTNSNNSQASTSQQASSSQQQASSSQQQASSSQQSGTTQKASSSQQSGTTQKASSSTYNN
jgi:hypothetical protein